MLRGFVQLLCLASAVCLHMAAQQPATDDSAIDKAHLASGVDRVAGTEPTSGIQYVRLVMPGKTVSAPGQQPAQTPSVMAQCSRRANGKSYFDLYARFGGAMDLTFYPPWKPRGPTDFPPRTQKVTITMDFLGYTHVKPAKKQWEIPIETPGQYRYNQPGFGSANMEDLSYYLQYLIALPTLRLTLDNQSAEFNMTPLLEQIRKEPMCGASRLK